MLPDAGNPCDTYLPGAEYSDNNCFLPVHQSVTLQDAKALCERRNAKVVEPSTAAQLEYLSKFAGWNFEPQGATWLGLSPHANAHTTFQWTSTGAWLDTTTNWATNEPPSDTLLTSGDQAVVMAGSGNWTWRIVSRFSLAQVVCQRDLAGECDGVFTSGRCFTLYPDADDWNEAKRPCALTTITDGVIPPIGRVGFTRDDLLSCPASPSAILDFIPYKLLPPERAAGMKTPLDFCRLLSLP
ncbi:hypothetical protein ElyMa_005533000 [Elysia marginata]|uniref:C-type lectin domain-containing protein n=1 Tax=Elysia marginata TaxID=1093978 RepID=A0AAV4EXT4_9GAST|nr:hypothetical protein ElyMa_005533000 [Elysia marginata]